MNKLMSLLTMKKVLDLRTFATKIITADGKEVLKKKVFETRITLIGSDNSISIMNLQEAQNLSARRELKLVKIQDEGTKTRRPVYKLMTSQEYHEEELQKRKERQTARQNSTIKGEKLLTLSSRIGQHDLMTGVKKMMKLLEKHYEVKVVLAGDGQQGVEKLDSIYSVIEEHTKPLGKVVQKRNKGNNLKFQIIPSRNSSESSSQSPDSEGAKGDKDGPL